MRATALARISSLTGRDASRMLGAGRSCGSCCHGPNLPPPPPTAPSDSLVAHRHSPGAADPSRCAGVPKTVPTVRSLEDSLPHWRWGRPIDVPGLGVVTRSPSLVIAVACALAVCVAGTAEAVGAAPATGSAAPGRPTRCPAPPTRSPTASVAPRRLATVPARSPAHDPAGTVQLTVTDAPHPSHVPNTWPTRRGTTAISRRAVGARPTVRLTVGPVARFRSALVGTGHGWTPSTRPSTPTRSSATTSTTLVPRRRRGALSDVHFTGLGQRRSNSGGVRPTTRRHGRPPDGSSTVLLRATSRPTSPPSTSCSPRQSWAGTEPSAAVDPVGHPPRGDVPPPLRTRPHHPKPSEVEASRPRPRVVDGAEPSAPTPSRGAGPTILPVNVFSASTSDPFGERWSSVPLSVAQLLRYRHRGTRRLFGDDDGRGAGSPRGCSRVARRD